MKTSPESGIMVDRPVFGGGMQLVPIGMLPMYWADWPRGENRFSTAKDAAALLEVATEALANQVGVSVTSAPAVVDVTGEGEEGFILIPDGSPFRMFVIAVTLETGGKVYSSQDFVGELKDAQEVARDGIDAWPRPAKVKLIWSASDEGFSWVAA